MNGITAVSSHELSYDDAVGEFLDYIREYRSFSKSTVKAYGTDMHRHAHVPRVPGEASWECAPAG